MRGGAGGRYGRPAAAGGPEYAARLSLVCVRAGVLRRSAPTVCPHGDEMACPRINSCLAPHRPSAAAPWPRLPALVGCRWGRALNSFAACDPCPKTLSSAAGSLVVTSSAVLLVRTATWPSLLDSSSIRRGSRAVLRRPCGSLLNLLAFKPARSPLRHPLASLVLKPSNQRTGRKPAANGALSFTGRPRAQAVRDMLVA